MVIYIWDTPLCFRKLNLLQAYHRLSGVNVLLPFAFHCTSMPIKASADKLAREIKQFGEPPVFPKKVEEQVVEQPTAEDASSSAPPDKFKGKKSKVAAKSGGQMYQWEIMRSVGISDSEISEFAPEKWLKYFPPLAVEDLKAFGLGCDWSLQR
ncbi:hypothetical protein Ddye_008277 [Dipteronia dyeriana]|uniref:Uncharacterized protein n=1 Tax=Dipteronia dyeriana TaxID=168575 RepID=A0AAE0CL61_9ROSI|nr:hypothetical protein Ddye_008277 [Dipteronia dyeriana]